MADPLFPVRNSFWLGAYQTAISEASHLTGLSEAQKVRGLWLAEAARLLRGGGSAAGGLWAPC